MALPAIIAGIAGVSSLISNFKKQNQYQAQQVQNKRARTAGLISSGTDIANNIANLAINATANRRNRKNWERMNKYNSPKEQMNRFKDAGLNPNMIYRGSTSAMSGNTTTPPDTKTSEFKFNANPIKEFINLKSTQAKTRNETAKYDNIIQDTLNKRFQATNTAVNTAKTWQDKQQANALFEGQMDLQAEEIRKTKLNNIGTWLDMHIKSSKLSAELLLLAEQTSYLTSQKKGLDLKNEYQTFINNLSELGITASDPVAVRMIGVLFPEEAKKYAKGVGNTLIGNKPKKGSSQRAKNRAKRHRTRPTIKFK